MAGNHITPAEALMRRTIDWLLELPRTERTLMEQAVSYAFTPESPAPSWKRSTNCGKLPIPPNGTVMVTLNAGAVEAATLLCSQGQRPAVLNFAHGYNCGGGFEHAGGSQEEDIFRKTSIFLSLWPHRRVDDGPGVLARGMWIGEYDAALARQEAFYPHTRCGGIYSPHVRVARKIWLPDRPLYPKEEYLTAPTFAVLTVAAQDVSREGAFDAALLHEKVRSTLYMAAAHGHDSVVLGAFGCGYFRNPPNVVAASFEEALKNEFKGAFFTSVFAVPDRGGPNLEEFAGRFPLMDMSELVELLPRQLALEANANDSDAALNAAAKKAGCAGCLIC